MAIKGPAGHALAKAMTRKFSAPSSHLVRL